MFFVRVDEGDDPPVYHDNGKSGGDYEDEDGEDGEEMASLADVSWERISDTYSGFIYSMVIRETP